MAQRSQIFVLDMGEPVRILDLAEKLIRLSGYEPYQDIDIREVGLRPGEKLYEELLTGSADLLHTANRKIFVEQPEQISRERISDALDKLRAAAAAQLPTQELISLLRSLIPTYRAPDEVNNQL